MARKLLSLGLLALFTLSVTGWLIAAEIKGKVAKVERDGRYITIKNPCKEVKIRISGSRTDLKGVGDRSDISRKVNRSPRPMTRMMTARLPAKSV